MPSYSSSPIIPSDFIFPFMSQCLVPYMSATAHEFSLASLRQSFADVRQCSRAPSNAVTDGGAPPRAAPTTPGTGAKAMSYGGAVSETPAPAGSKSPLSQGTAYLSEGGRGHKGIRVTGEIAWGGSFLCHCH